MEKTLVIIKPDAVSKNLIGEIISRFEKDGLRVAGLKKIHMTKQQAKGFYIVHKDKPFYESLTDFMSEGPVVVMVLEGEFAVAKVRKIMGVTDPARAEEGTIRKDFGESIERNAVHGSDSPGSADYEIQYFFSALEIL